MRFVIDMQGAQTESRFRGIGRYTLSLAQAIARNRGEHEVFLLLNGLLPQAIQDIRAEFAEILPRENIRVWYASAPTRDCDPANGERRDIAEKIREAAIAHLQPNAVLVASLFEGFGDDAVTSIGLFDGYTPTAVILYDLIPLITPDENFRTNPVHIGYYKRKIDSLKKAAALLAISESSCGEALSALDWDPTRVVNISSGCDSRFKVVQATEEEQQALREKYSINGRFVMYTGGADERKNLDRLIQAFAALPSAVRKKHQLVFVGRMPDAHIRQFLATAKRAGLKPQELVFTGYVSDRELMLLYGLSSVFVFPSLHEGFGLPPLEAMACGAPVIGANATSLPEVIGRADAMFDPLSVPEMAAKIAKVLTDGRFRQELIDYGFAHVQKFSWDASATAALKILETIARPACVVSTPSNVRHVDTGLFRPQHKRILVSKLDHMGDLVLAIPAIMKLRARYPDARIDALIGSWNVEAAKLLAVFDHIYTLDFFSKKSAEAAYASGEKLDALVGTMPHYDLALDFRRQRDTRFILLRIPANVHVGYATCDSEIDDRLDVCLPTELDEPFRITSLNGTSIAAQMVSIVDALPSEQNDYIKIPQLFSRASDGVRRVAIFPKAGNDVKEWGVSNYSALIDLLAADRHVDEITVYVTNHDEIAQINAIKSTKLTIKRGLPYKELLASLARHELCIANNSFGGHLASILGLKVVAIYGGHETVEEWGPVYNSSLVVNANTACSPCHIAHRNECKNEFSCFAGITPKYVRDVVVAKLVSGDTQESLLGGDALISKLIEEIAPYAARLPTPDRESLSDSLARNFPASRKPILFVDVSELAVQDSRTGIQRVVRSILACLLKSPPRQYDVLPVYAIPGQVGYRVARAFLNNFLGGSENPGPPDELIDYQSGDVFLGLDLALLSVLSQQNTLTAMRNHGVRVLFVVYDILCARMPQHFDDGLVAAFNQWLHVVAESDGVLCISRAVRDDFLEWMREQGVVSERNFHSSWFHLGADIENSRPTTGMPPNANALLKKMRDARNVFLMVGTLEPRKGHAQTLSAFEDLWASGFEGLLIIIGKPGWNIDVLASRLRDHEEHGYRLFWHETASDEFLSALYANSHCLIAASEGEGFGLPLIEAARHGIPIIARDLPVFREVAGSNAKYFSGKEPERIATAVLDWLELSAIGNAPSSSDIPWLTWARSALQLQRAIGIGC